MLDNLHAVAVKPLVIARLAMIELREVLPLDGLALVLARGAGNASVGLADKPLGMLARQRRINRAMVDDEVHHEPQPVLAAGVECFAALLFGRGGAAGVEEGGIKAEVIRDRIKT